MKKTGYKIVGVMSGTSLDGIDLAVVNFEKDGPWTFSTGFCETYSYSGKWKDRLSTAVNLPKAALDDLNQEYTTYLAGVINDFITKNEIQGIDAISSHGHTVKHEPENQYTLQIGNLPFLAKNTGERIVCDFRVQDVKLGGQGAPLVPIGDRLLFSQYKFCLNLGGFANISLEQKEQRIAYDLCPVNTVLNFYANKLGLEFDRGGQVAASGNLIPELLAQLENLDFYKMKPPKSLGIEWVHSKILPILKKYEGDIPSILNTFCHHVASQISNSLDNDSSSEVLVTGGGAFNTFLINLIRAKTNTRLVIPSEDIINYKEAIIFAFLGVLKLRNEINVLSSVTGAGRDHSSGYIYKP